MKPMVFFFVDGGCRRNGQSDAEGYASIRVIGRKNRIYRIDLANCRTNNEAEYGAIIMALCMLVEKAPAGMAATIYSDSQHVIGQIRGTRKLKARNLMKFHLHANILLGALKNRGVEVHLMKAPREMIVEQLGH